MKTILVIENDQFAGESIAELTMTQNFHFLTAINRLDGIKQSIKLLLT